MYIYFGLDDPMPVRSKRRSEVMVDGIKRLKLEQSDKNITDRIMKKAKAHNFVNQK